MRIAVDVLQQRLVELGLGEVDAAPARRAVGDGLGYGVRLLVDLLEHERLVAALLGGRLVPVHVRDLTLQRSAVGREELHAVGAQHHDLAVLDELHVARVREEGGDGGAEELLAVAAADDQRALLARPHEGARLVGAHRDERVVALELVVGGANGLGEAAQRHVVGDEVGDDLCVRLRRVVGAHVGHALLERQVVLDDPVDDDVDAVARVEVRMGVGLGHATVRGPAGVADAAHRVVLGDGDRDGRPALVRIGAAAAVRDRLPQLAEVSDRAHRGDLAAGEDRHACGVIAAVLEFLQAGEEDLLGRALANVSDDSTHARRLGERAPVPAAMGLTAPPCGFGFGRPCRDGGETRTSPARPLPARRAPRA